MTTYSTNEFKGGLKVMIDGDPCSIIENEFVKPGKGQAFNRVKFRNLKTNKTLEKTFKSGDNVDGADILDIEAQYLYNDGESWHFMDPNTYEQYAINETAIDTCKQWLKEQDTYILTLWNGEALTITPPNFVILKIVDTDPGLRGDTSGGGGKPATLETGAVIRVPLFVQVDELIKVDTRIGEYVSRAK